MDKLRLILESPRDFNEMSSVLQDKTVLNLTFNVLSDLVTPNIKNSLIKEFLSSWIINRFPRDILGSEYEAIPITLKLKEASNNLINTYSQSKIPLNKFRKDLVHFNILFSEWKKYDYNEIVNNMFFKYHELGVDILNAPDENCKQILEECREEILKKSFKIGGQNLINEIKSFSPLVINVEELFQQNSKAFWDLTNDHFKENNFTEIFIILEHILELLGNLSPSRKDYFVSIIDIPFIRQQVEHKVFNKIDIETLATQLISILETIQAPIHDIETRELQKNLNENGVYLPDFLKQVLENLTTTANEIFEMKEKLKDKKD